MLDVFWLLPEQIGKRASQNFKKHTTHPLRNFWVFVTALYENNSLTNKLSQRPQGSHWQPSEG